LIAGQLPDWRRYARNITGAARTVRAASSQDAMEVF